MGPSSLIDPSIVVVADASAAINLNATGCAAKILRALPNRLHMADIAFNELDIDRRNGRDDAKIIGELAATGLVIVSSLGTIGISHFESLVVGPGRDTLDDGEAATIALGIELNGLATLDERKAIRICGERFPNLPVACTMDILSHDAVLAALGQHLLADAVFNALQDARMRVLPRYTDWVVNLIGGERTASCPSLPRNLR